MCTYGDILLWCSVGIETKKSKVNHLAPEEVSIELRTTSKHQPKTHSTCSMSHKASGNLVRTEDFLSF